MELTFTKHPFLQPPTDEEIVMLGESDPKLLEQLYKAHEGRIQAAEDDPCDLERTPRGEDDGRGSARRGDGRQRESRAPRGRRHEEATNSPDIRHSKLVGRSVVPDPGTGLPARCRQGDRGGEPAGPTLRARTAEPL